MNPLSQSWNINFLPFELKAESLRRARPTRRRQVGVVVNGRVWALLAVIAGRVSNGAAGPDIGGVCYDLCRCRRGFRLCPNFPLLLLQVLLQAVTDCLVLSSIRADESGS